MDETGFSIGYIQGINVMVNKTFNRKFHAHPGRQEWAGVNGMCLRG